MGFYGNVADTSKIHFQFDRIFNSRSAMESSLRAGEDGVFTGRFVLIKYDPNGSYVDYTLLSGYYNDGYMYANYGLSSPYYYTTFTQVASPSASHWEEYYIYDGVQDYFPLQSEDYYTGSDVYYKVSNTTQSNLVYKDQIVRGRDLTTTRLTDTYYQCTGENSSNHRAIFVECIPSHAFSDYIKNYNIDKTVYDNSFDPRGYDGTVWQKVYSGGHGKFILVASLNGSVPELELSPTSPSLFPSAPYIDGRSGGSLYRICVPSHWGFRIKESTPVIVYGNQGEMIETFPYSDVEVDQQYKKYHNEEYQNPPQSHRIHADIYFNKKANNKQYSYYENTIANEITIAPTGASGDQYYDSTNPNNIDTYELSVHLPMLGNLIAEGYDMLYGVHNSVDDNGNYPRYTDINFYPGDSGEELKVNGNSLLGGKTHDLTTVAGNINTMHDIIGQIVCPLNTFPNDEQVKTLSAEYIYTYDNYYYRKGYGFEKTIIQDSDYTFEQQTNVTAADFDNNKYYKNSGGRKVWAHSYESSLGASGYYLRKVNGVRYSPITLIQYEQSTYFTRRGEDYIMDNHADYPTYTDRTYYSVTTDGGRAFYGQYTSDGSFFIKNGVNYIPSHEDSPNITTTYYGITKARTLSNQLYYYPGAFYIKSGNRFVLAEEDNLSDYPSGTTFYILIFSNIPEYGYSSDGSIVQYYEVINDPNLPQYQIDSFSTLPANTNINSLYIQLEDGSYINYSDIGNLPTTYTDGVETVNRNPYTIPRDYYTLNIVTYAPGSLYLPGVYYIHTQDGNYEKTMADLDTLHNQGYTDFYLITSATPLEHPFYQQDTYYYENPVGSDHFDPDGNLRMTNGRQYYEKTAVFVESDETETCPHGYEWSDWVGYVPPSLTLYTIKKKPALIQMPGLGNDTNCLFGLLLYLNKLYGAGEEDSRDMDTVRGLYNKLTDLLYQIKTLKPGTILTVNTFGQIDSFDAGPNKIFMTTEKGNLTSVTLSQLKTLLNNA